MNRYNYILLEAISTLLLCLVITAGSAQPQQTIGDRLLYEKVQHLSDSIDKLNTSKAALYLGYDISLAFPQYQIQSNISQLNNLRANFVGGAIGGVVANQRGKVKADLGLYYSDGSVPYTIDMYKASVSSSAYLLRLNHFSYHTLEPYSVIGITHQVDKFFGHYLDNTSRRNYSVTDEPLLGKVSTTQITFGGGLEYQLENDNHKFIHLFAEFTVAKNIKTTSSNSSFSGTTISDPLLITVGVNFGIVK